MTREELAYYDGGMGERKRILRGIEKQIKENGNVTLSEVLDIIEAKEKK